MKDNIVELKNISFRYDKRKTDGISDLSLKIKEKECVCLIGPSGSGKTTTAKMIGQLIAPQVGEITFANQAKTAYVAQNSDLPYDLTVFEYLNKSLNNIENEKKENLIRTTLLQLNISNEIHSHLGSISGGQRQRVIIAQALIQNPNLILLDEPFGHLDEKLRSQLMQELFSLFKEKDIACLWVTHETQEALSFSDRIVLLNYGVIQQVGTPKELYQAPKNLFTAQFFGHTNALASKLISSSQDELVVKLFNKEVIVPSPTDFKAQHQDDILLIVRPENISIQPDGIYSGTIKKILYQGSRYLLEVQISGHQAIWLYVPGHLKPIKNKKININIDYSQVFCLDEI